MKFRLVELDNDRNILKEYYRSPNVFTEEDFDELKKKCIEKYSKQLDFHNIFSNRRFEIQKTEDNVLWKRYSNPARDYYDMI